MLNALQAVSGSAVVVGAAVSGSAVVVGAAVSGATVVVVVEGVVVVVASVVVVVITVVVVVGSGVVVVVGTSVVVVTANISTDKTIRTDFSSYVFMYSNFNIHCIVKRNKLINKLK